MIWQSQQKDFLLFRAFFLIFFFSFSEPQRRDMAGARNTSLQDELSEEKSNEDGCYDNKEGGQEGGGGFSADNAGWVWGHVVWARRHLSHPHSLIL